MVYTSYFANLKNLTELESISIARFSPSFYKGEELKILSPSEELLSAIKNNIISEEDYDEFFWKYLQTLDINQIKNNIENKVLLCYEKKGDFCHRHIVSRWLNKNGIETIEL